MIEILVSLLPAFIFLITLIYLDSYKLVKITTVSLVILIGFAAALISFTITKFLLTNFSFELSLYTKYVSPIIEETIKASFIIYMISKKQIGFTVDAAIYGFAIGAGFSFIENIYYLNVLESSNLFLWIIRGFGTAVMHGGTTAIFSIITKNLFDRSESLKFKNFLLALISAIIIHSFFNHLLLPAVTITVLQLILLPALLVFVFQRSELALQEWMDSNIDNEVEILDQINKGIFSESHAGEYLLSLRNKFSGIVLSDMLCLIRIHLELSVRAKGVLLLRKAGLPVLIEEEVKDKLEELKYLENSIGTTGKLAVAPIFKTSTRDLWQLFMLGK
ncbi:MAG: PrsW family intramembrane metalloprotease [Ignavibacteriae bacterium]|nr:PrsW family intramembrane metalloprotease [Ignavibacteriota bacterium]